MARSEAPRGALADGLWLPMITPLQHDCVALDTAQRLAAHYAAAGVDGLIVLGTTGEGGLLTDSERSMLAAAVLEAVDGAVPVIAGVGGVATHAVCDQVRKLDRLALAGYLVPPPYYLRVSDEGIAWHMRSVAGQTGKPLMLYNVPKRTGCTMSPELVWRLAAHPQIVAIKECDPAGLRTLAMQDRIGAFCGDDASMFDHLLRGGTGIVPAAAHVRPELFVRLLQLARTGREEAARALFRQLSPLIGLLFAEPNPAPVKAALALCGMATAEVRRPLMPASKTLVAQLDAAMALLPPAAVARAA